jgi:hypothetical protein
LTKKLFFLYHFFMKGCDNLEPPPKLGQTSPATPLRRLDKKPAGKTKKPCEKDIAESL